MTLADRLEQAFEKAELQIGARPHYGYLAEVAAIEMRAILVEALQDYAEELHRPEDAERFADAILAEQEKKRPGSSA